MFALDILNMLGPVGKIRYIFDPMEEFVSLLKTLKKNDKITQNVLFMICESSRHMEGDIGQALVKQYRKSINKEPLLDFLFILCGKDTKYLSFFKTHRKEFDRAEHKFVGLLEDSERDTKKMKLNSSDVPSEEKVKDVGLGGNRGDRVKTEHIGNATGDVHGQTVPGVSASGVFEEALAKNSVNKSDVDMNILDNRYLGLPAAPSVLYPQNQCKLCGLRFENTAQGDEAISVHIDEHRRKTRALSEKECVSREFFPTLEAWTKNIEKVKLSLKVEKAEKIVHSGGPATCEICHNKIEVEWDDQEDDWILKDAVSLEKAGEVKFCHRKCVL